ncbi:RNA polymerase sigma factor [Pseudoflavonifractor sp. 60]|uniref:RNA polymerase sigma factor n=1 Tax=Pseudoflavonifractor sp. 60 TaxID=2304576 RepID=UPI001369FDBC|nr:RNA polymerase sigma factor [Pseudoflavonifractor sp. 60]NBI69041.1 RNA polymerase sigma factor [Pseudoflavonifractor sp. 60]
MLVALSVQTTEEGSIRELEQLLVQVGRGDRESFAALYARTRGAVYALALSLLQNTHEAQDVSQDVFVRVWESAHTYRPQGSPMAWLLTITRNLALTQLRRSGRETALEEEEWDAIPASAPCVTPEDRQVLQEALGELRAEERRIILLHAAAGLKYREIAALLELPLSTVLSKYHRGLKKLKSLMKGEKGR